jgi:hypothetical protein
MMSLTRSRRAVTPEETHPCPRPSLDHSRAGAGMKGSAGVSGSCRFVLWCDRLVGSNLSSRRRACSVNLAGTSNSRVPREGRTAGQGERRPRTMAGPRRNQPHHHRLRTLEHPRRNRRRPATRPFGPRHPPVADNLTPVLPFGSSLDHLLQVASPPGPCLSLVVVDTRAVGRRCCSMFFRTKLSLPRRPPPCPVRLHPNS